jgi:F-type H+-transporting ATPase subunit gamma
MPSLKAIRRRISSVKNTRKITKAMKMVAASRLRKAQSAILELRPYAIDTHEVLSSVARRAGEADVHPLLARRAAKEVMLVVITSDRGLCGGFNASINRAADQYLKSPLHEHEHITLATIGRKGRDYFRRRNREIRHEFTKIFDGLDYQKAAEIARVIIASYTKEDSDIDAVYLVYNEFKSAMTQKVTVEQLLPITPLPVPEDDGGVDFIYEPTKKALLNRLLPMYVEVELYRALLESQASEHGARMTAMEAASNNANELIARLTLDYNRARQAAITKELMEIIGGAEALKG